MTGPAYLSIRLFWGSLVAPQVHRVQRITPEGLITNFAGNGTASSTGDGGLAQLAGVREPRAIAAAPDGSVYIGQGSPPVIRRVDPRGIITTVAGQEPVAGFGGSAPALTVGSIEDMEVAPDGPVLVLTIRSGQGFVIAIGTDDDL